MLEWEFGENEFIGLEKGVLFFFFVIWNFHLIFFLWKNWELYNSRLYNYNFGLVLFIFLLWCKIIKKKLFLKTNNTEIYLCRWLYAEIIYTIYLQLLISLWLINSCKLPFFLMGLLLYLKLNKGCLDNWF